MKHLLTLLICMSFAFVGLSMPNTEDMKKLDLSEINQVEFPSHQYVKVEQNKTQVVLHHTVSGKSIKGDLAHWNKTKARVATAIIISRDGTINQLFPSKYWAYHLGIKTKEFNKFNLPYKNLEKTSIGIEFDSYGGLTKENGIFKTAYNQTIEADSVTEYSEPFRGYSYFESYTDEQIESARQLLVFWNERYDIPLKYNDMFGLNRDALRGVSGVYTHASFRSDKSDCHPQPELITMLRNLSLKTV